MDTANAPSRLRSMPSWLLNQAALPAQRLVGGGLDRVRAHRSHYAVLAAIEEFGPDSQAALGRRCGIDRSDMVALVHDLEAGELVERSVDAEDRRRNIIAITQAGRRRLRALDRVLAGIQDDLLAPLSPAERSELIRLLTVLVDHHTDR